MFLKFHGSILSEIVLITICLEQKGLKPPIKKLYNLVFKLEEATQRKSQEKKKIESTKELNDLLPSTLLSDLDISKNDDSSFSDNTTEVVDVYLF